MKPKVRIDWRNYFFLIENILVSEVMDGIDWSKYSLCFYDADTDKNTLLKDK